MRIKAVVVSFFTGRILLCWKRTNLITHQGYAASFYTSNPQLSVISPVNLAVDVVAGLDKFANHPFAPSKVLVDLVPAAPDRAINITDVTAGIDAFRA